MMTLREHLELRGMNPDNYNVVMDEENMTATFLLYSLTGALIGYQQYKPLAEKKAPKGEKYKPKDLRYFTQNPDNKPHACFGIDQFDRSKGPLYIVEGIFDAVKFHNLELNCFAVLSNAPSRLRSFFDAMSMPTCAVVDGDAAGLELAKLCDTYMICPAGTDPGDMSEMELGVFLSNRQHCSHRNTLS